MPRSKAKWAEMGSEPRSGLAAASDRPTIRAPTTTETTAPAGVNPNRNSATIVKMPAGSSSALWAGREKRRNAVMLQNSVGASERAFGEAQHTASRDGRRVVSRQTSVVRGEVDPATDD